MEGVDWKELLAMLAVVGMFTGIVIKWLRVEQQLKQIRYHMGLDEDGNPAKDSTGKPRRQIDSEFVRSEIKTELERYYARKDARTTIPIKEGDSA